jgi:hypothetical protein
VTLRSPADAYVRDGSFANTNFGQAVEMQVKNVTAPGWSREAYLRFDLTGVASADRITSAFVRVFGRQLDQFETTVKVGIYPVSPAGWTESGLTWNNRPAPTAAPLMIGDVAGGSYSLYQFNVTEYLRQQKAAGATSVAFALRAPIVSEGWAGFVSDEASAQRPELHVEQT